MNSKTKLTLTITAMVMVTLIAIVSIIAVFAARTQNFSSNVSVKYTATQITGKVSAKYYVGPTDTSGTAMTTTGKEGGATELVFRPGDKQITPNTLNPLGDIILEVEDATENIPDKSWVVFEYVFQNGLGTKVDTDYLATMSFVGEATNIKICTAESDSKITDFSQIKTSVSSPNNFISQVLVEHKQESNYIAYKYFYVKAEISNIAKDSLFSGNFAWDLAYHDPADLLPTLDKLVFYRDGTVGPSANAVGDIVIPETYNGVKVTRIEDGPSNGDGMFANRTEITSVHFPAGFNIGDYAFNGCQNLTSVTFGDGFSRIGKGAFQETGIIELSIPGGGDIEENAFLGCHDLKTVIINGNVLIMPGAFAGTFVENVYLNANVQGLSPNCFANVHAYAPATITIEGESLCNWQAIGAAFIDYFNNSGFHITLKTKYEMRGEYNDSSGSFNYGSLQDSFVKSDTQINGYWEYECLWV